MRVLLVSPSSDATLGTWQPLGLGYLAASLASGGHEVRVLDRAGGRNDADPDQALLGTCREFAPDLIGLTATTPLIPDALHVMERVRSALPETLTVLGGPHATALPERTLRECPCLDAVAVGEGEYTVCDLADGRALADTPGLAYWENEAIRLTAPCRRAENLDDLPPPRRDLLSPDRYFRPTDQIIRGLRLRAAHIITGRGCTHRCKFCAGPLCFGGKVRLHSIERVLHEIHELLTVHSLNGFYIADDVFLANAERTVAFCEAAIRAGVQRRAQWCCQLRVTGLSPEVLRLLKRAGCAQVEFGLESGSQYVLDLMRKRATVEENVAAVRLAREAGLRVFANIIVGYPGEREQDLLATREMLTETKPDAMSVNRFAPLPGSEAFEELAAEGRLPEDWRAYTVGNSMNFTEMPTERFEALVGAL
ncbi:MAG: B12-binding domain-containing radical SAM protein, partial [Armatimonadetes bacterium]|nr:B12-binding domain-containing radical SAM protein [Armatimonadota bacterium]